MKQIKKIAGILLALVMAFTLTVPAYAETVDGHTYNVYQIFSGTQEDPDGLPLGDVAWGTGIDGAAFLASLKADVRFGADDANIFKDCTTALDVAAVLGATNEDGSPVYADKSDVAKAFANVAAQHLTSTVAATVADGQPVTLDPGYYLVVDTTDVSGGNDARNSALLQVTHKGDFTIEKKYTVPTVDKEVTDSDGTQGEAADYSIGSDIPFTLTGTLPSNYSDYETYTYQFNDTLSAGLQYNGDAKVYVDNNGTKTDVTSSFTAVPNQAATTGGGTLTVSIADLKNLAGVTADSKIVVEYTAKLTAAAAIGSAGNKNEVTLTFSNDPNNAGAGTTGTTPMDEVLVFTYELDVTKVDGKDDSKKLANAEFKLRNEAGKWVTVDTDGKVNGWADTEDAGSILKSGTDGLFKVVGLDAGTYYLKETKAPIGYNLLKDEIKLVINATVNKIDKQETLTALSITVGEGQDATTTAGVLDTGIVSTAVKNNAGAVLPETGGMGTTLFYVLGSALVLGAVVLLITKKRMNTEK